MPLTIAKTKATARTTKYPMRNSVKKLLNKGGIVGVGVAMAIADAGVPVGTLVVDVNISIISIVMTATAAVMFMMKP